MLYTLVSIIAYNDGAKKPAREKQAFRWALGLSLGSMALRILAVSMLPGVYGSILGAVLQALGKGVASMALSVARQAVFLLPLMWLLQSAGSLELIWGSFLAAELMGMALGFCLHRKKYRLFIEAEKPEHSFLTFSEYVV